MISWKKTGENFFLLQNSLKHYFSRHVEDMVKVFRDDLKFINVFVILFKETDMRLDKVI